MSLKHNKVVTVADNPDDAAKLRPSDWGSTSTDYNTTPTHIFSGGALNSLLYRDTLAVEGFGWTDSPTLVSLGLGAAAKTGPVLYVNNVDGPGILIKGGTTSDFHSGIVFQNSAGSVRAAFNPEGMYYTNGWLTISGGFTATLDANGNINSFTAGGSGLNTMLDVISDVAGPTIVAKATSLGYNFQGLDVSGNYTFSIGKDGALQWGAGATFGSMDTTLYRTGAGLLQMDTPSVGNSTSAYGLTLANPTAATAGTQVQNSPALKLSGAAWNTSSLVSEADTWELVGTFVAGNPTTSQLGFYRRIAGGAQSAQFTVSSAGNVTIVGSLDMTNGNLTIGATGEFRHNGRTRFGSAGTGLFTLINNANTAGVGLDVTTDGTLILRNRAHSADGHFRAASVRGSAVAFTNVPASPVEGMLVAVTDSTTATWGATITGGGSNHVLAYYNGTNWTVAAK